MKIAKVDALIHIIRGQRVMLDRDLAELYGVPTGQFNRAVNRAPSRLLWKIEKRNLWLKKPYDHAS